MKKNVILLDKFREEASIINNLIHLFFISYIIYSFIVFYSIYSFIEVYVFHSLQGSKLKLKKSAK